MEKIGKALIIIIDGISDRQINNETPLSKANTPNMDKLASNGINGIMDTIAPGIRPGSDTGHLALLGYDPFKYYSGRGPIEAAGAGIETNPGDIAFRVNFSTVKGNGSIFDKIVVDRRAGRISETQPLVDAIMKNVSLEVEFTLAKGSGHRAALVLRGDNLSDKISDTDPKVIGEKVKRCEPLVDKSSEEYEIAKFTAEVVNEFMEKSHQILEEHPLNKEREKKGLLKANALLLRGVGKVPHIPSFESRYNMKLAVISGTTLIRGIGSILGGDLIEVKGMTGGKDTNIEGKVEMAVKCLENYDFVLLHFKAPDEYGHDGDFEGKMKFLEKIDSKLKPVLNLNFSKVCLILTGDHSTPVNVKEHTADPVPVTIVFDGVRVDEVKKFSEFEAYKGGLCRIRGVDLMNIVLDLINRAKKFGA